MDKEKTCNKDVATLTKFIEDISDEKDKLHGLVSAEVVRAIDELVYLSDATFEQKSKFWGAVLSLQSKNVGLRKKK